MSQIVLDGVTHPCTVADLARWDGLVAADKAKTREEAAAAALRPKRRSASAPVTKPKTDKRKEARDDDE